MKISWIRRRTVVALTAGSVALAAFGAGESGLLAGLFSKNRCELPRRLPDDCSFGYTPTVWRPWGTCCETTASPYSPQPVFVPGGGYVPLDDFPGPALSDTPQQGAPIIIEPQENETALPPILSDPNLRTTPEKPGRPAAAPGNPSRDTAPRNTAPLTPDVRSTESPVSDHDGLPQHSDPAARQYRGPVEAPIRGLLPGGTNQPAPSQAPAPSQTPVQTLAPAPTVAPPQTAAPPQPTAPAETSQGSVPAAGLRTPPAGMTLPFNATQFAPAGQRSKAGIDYSEYVPLPQADSIPQPPAESREASGPTRLRVSGTQRQSQPQRPLSGALPQSSTLPGESLSRSSSSRSRTLQPGRSTDHPDSSRQAADTDPYSDYRPLPAAAAVQPLRQSQPAAAENSYETPEWKPLSDPAKTYRSAAPQHSGEWRTLQTPAGRGIERASSQPRQLTSRVTAPPWRSPPAPSDWRDRHVRRREPAIVPASATSSNDPVSSGRMANSRASDGPASPGQFRRLPGVETLPDVEVLIGRQRRTGSRPARVVRETLYDVIDVRPAADRRWRYGRAVPVEAQSVLPSEPVTGSRWQPIRSADGRTQSIARSSRLTPR